MRLKREDLQELGAAGIKVPGYDRQAMIAATERAPVWVHFGAGNIFRGFIAAVQQRLLEAGLAEAGILAAEGFDGEIITRAYEPFDCMTLLVTLLADGTTQKEVVGSVARGLRADGSSPEDWEALCWAFRQDSLQMVSFTITEKGYALKGMQGNLLPGAKADLEKGPTGCGHAMGQAAALLLERYKAGGAPVAMVSMDNCSHNGDKLREGVLAMAQGWLERGLVPGGFVEWLKSGQVSFPWTMIDKITPRPAPQVAASLKELGLKGMEPFVTGKGTYTAGFVNAEQPQYLVVEDNFPNGRPPLEKAGVYMADRATVDLTERMKVTTCLNPLHTALAVFGCLLGYKTIAQEMGNAGLQALVRGIGYQEGLPVVEDPGILSPKDFLDEVVEKRLPNPFIPDTPQRIATDTSQKVGIRFGETIKRYGDRAGALTFIPLAIAGWLRYLLAVDDKGQPMAVSPDPLLSQLQGQLEGIRFGEPDTVTEEALAPILSNQALFGVDLLKVGLGPAVVQRLRELAAGPGAVQAVLDGLRR